MWRDVSTVKQSVIKFVREIVSACVSRVNLGEKIVTTI